MEARQVYLDHNATTPLHPYVVTALTEAMEAFGNPSSMHAHGRAARDYVEDARAEVASFLGAEPEEILFVGSGSEANNTVLSILSCPACASNQCFCKNMSRRQIITTRIEHPCVLETVKCAQARGNPVHFLDVDAEGRVSPESAAEAAGEQTGMVSVMMANNEIGTIQDIAALAEAAHEKGALFHTDAVQAVGKVPIDVKALGVDFLTLSAHKIYGPKGIGALYVRKGVPFCPLIRGGHQERGRRAGTENTLGIVGLGAAVKMRRAEMDEEHKRLGKFRAALREGIASAIPDTHFNGHPTECLASTLNVSFEGAEGEAILLYLDLEGISVSTGSACASGSLDPSHVLLAMDTPIERAHGSIRISMGRGTTEADIAYVLDVLPRVIDKIRSMSTVYAGKRS